MLISLSYVPSTVLISDFLHLPVALDYLIQEAKGREVIDIFGYLGTKGKQGYQAH